MSNIEMNGRAFLIATYNGHGGTLNVSNVNLSGNLSATGTGIGGLVGQISIDSLNIKNVIVEGTITGGTYVAGLIGENWTFSNIDNVINAAQISVSSGYAAGIIADYDDANNNTISNLINFGDITAVTNAANIGGIFGYGAGTISNVYNDGNITGGSYYTGGIIGYGDGVLSNVSNDGDVNGYYATGGIIGSSSRTTINNAINKGLITASDRAYTTCSSTGGLIGISDSSVTINDSINYGNIQSMCTTSNSNVGEIYGSGTPILNNATNEGTIIN